jgi:hypothetical protein
VAIFVLTWGTGPSSWTTFVVVGALVAALGGLLVLLSAWRFGASGPAQGLVPILGSVLLVAGAATILGGVGLRVWGREHPDAP